MLVVYCQFYSSPFKSAYWFTMSSQQKSIILNWNVWGLNNPARRQVVQDLVADHRCDIVCLQETKIQAMDDSVVTATLGQDFCQHYAAFPVAGTRGGGGGACLLRSRFHNGTSNGADIFCHGHNFKVSGQRSVDSHRSVRTPRRHRQAPSYKSLDRSNKQHLQTGFLWVIST
jgi:exonuclease III